MKMRRAGVLAASLIINSHRLESLCYRFCVFLCALASLHEANHYLVDGKARAPQPLAPSLKTPHIFNSSRVRATAAADCCSMASSEGVSFMVRIFSTPLAPKITGTPKKRSLSPYSPVR